MRLMNEIFTRMGMDEEVIYSGVKSIIIDGRGGYFQNITGISSFSLDKIVLEVPGGSITICGDKLFIKKYGGKDLIIGGNIISTERSKR